MMARFTLASMILFVRLFDSITLSATDQDEFQGVAEILEVLGGYA